MKTKVHTIYKTKDGIRVPSVTTILGILDKPALVKWAWQCGIDGEDYRKVRDKAADIGTIAHYLIECYLKKEAPDLRDYSQDNIEKAQISFNAFLDFEKGHHLKPIVIEQTMVSNKYKFGGTIDLIAEMDGVIQLIDFKTSKGIYPEMIIQLSAYEKLVNENGIKVKENSGNILNINKETGEFHHYHYPDLSQEWEMFQHLVPVYSLWKDIIGRDKQRWIEQQEAKQKDENMPF